MAKFAYSARTASGETTQGTISAKDDSAAIARLRKKGLTGVNVEEKISKGFSLPGIGGVPTQDLVIFTRTFVTMLEAGLPIVQALDILGAQAQNKTLQKTLAEVKDTVEQGATLADSLRRHPKVFDQLYTNLVEAGEAGGVLDTVLNRLAVFLEKQEKIRKEVKGAMTYPIITLVIAFGAVAIMLLKVIPTFEKMFADFDRELPGLTLMVIGWSKWLQTNWPVVFGVPVGIFVGFSMMRQWEPTARGLDWLLLRMPLFGNLIKKSALTRFNQTLGTLMASGVPIVDALNICKGVVGNRIIADDVDTAVGAIQEGKTFVEPLRDSKYFPEMMVQMVEVGEQTGRLDQMLERVAGFYEEQVEAAVEALTSAIEPFMMVFLGGIVGGLLAAMYMPIFTLAGG